jgi:hypothetical protein
MAESTESGGAGGGVGVERSGGPRQDDPARLDVRGLVGGGAGVDRSGGGGEGGGAGVDRSGGGGEGGGAGVDRSGGGGEGGGGDDDDDDESYARLLGAQLVRGDLHAKSSITLSAQYADSQGQRECRLSVTFLKNPDATLDATDMSKEGLVGIDAINVQDVMATLGASQGLKDNNTWYSILFGPSAPRFGTQENFHNDFKVLVASLLIRDTVTHNPNADVDAVVAYVIGKHTAMKDESNTEKRFTCSFQLENSYLRVARILEFTDLRDDTVIGDYIPAINEPAKTELQYTYMHCQLAPHADTDLSKYIMDEVGTLKFKYRGSKEMINVKLNIATKDVFIYVPVVVYRPTGEDPRYYVDRRSCIPVYNSNFKPIVFTTNASTELFEVDDLFQYLEGDARFVSNYKTKPPMYSVIGGSGPEQTTEELVAQLSVPHDSCIIGTALQIIQPGMPGDVILHENHH